MKIIKCINKYLFWIFNAYKFKKLSLSSYILSPLRIDGKKNIYIGDKVIIQYKTWLASVPISNNKNSLLKIDNGTIIGNFNHIYATNKIIIGKNVLLADKVYISDNLHNYSNIDLPIMHQSIRQIGEVNIGDGAWIGENVCILGASVGKNSVIGSNSVVTKDIPDYCVAVGAPAKIIKKYNKVNNKWERI